MYYFLFTYVMATMFFLQPMLVAAQQQPTALTLNINIDSSSRNTIGQTTTSTVTAPCPLPAVSTENIQWPYITATACITAALFGYWWTYTNLSLITEQMKLFSVWGDWKGNIPVSVLQQLPVESIKKELLDDMHLYYHTRDLHKLAALVFDDTTKELHALHSYLYCYKTISRLHLTWLFPALNTQTYEKVWDKKNRILFIRSLLLELCGSEPLEDTFQRKISPLLKTNP